MKIQVLYFAIFRERLSKDEEAIELPDGATVSAALLALEQRYEVIQKLRGRFQTAVNQEMVGHDTVLRDGDELVLIPPVAGGMDDATSHAARHVRIVEVPPSVDRCTEAVTTARMGGIVTFAGVVRDHNDGHAVVRLEYEAYAAMAEKVMRTLCDQIEAEIPGSRIAVEHRVGVLGIGDIAVAIAAAAAHRAEAFEACRAMIDRLKENVPIWKKEISPDGDEWIGLGP